VNGIDPIVVASLVVGAMLAAFGLVMFLLMGLSKNENR
jgi:hypothetical protein